MRLGEYLMMKGMVSKTDIDQARSMQKVNNHLIGVLAVDRGMMTCDELEDVLDRQSRQEPHRLFGEIAVECQYLTRSQVELLLDLQASNHLRIGETLVLQSKISESELIEALRGFRAHRDAKGRQIA